MTRILSFYETACFDPATLSTLALFGTIAGGAGGVATAANALFGAKSSGAAAAPSMPAAAPPVQSPVGSQSGSSQAGPGPSFLAAAAAPSAQQTGTKSLLGQ